MNKELFLETFFGDTIGHKKRMSVMYDAMMSCFLLQSGGSLEMELKVDIPYHGDHIYSCKSEVNWFYGKYKDGEYVGDGVITSDEVGVSKARFHFEYKTKDPISSNPKYTISLKMVSVNEDCDYNPVIAKKRICMENKIKFAVIDDSTLEATPSRWELFPRVR